MPNTTIRYANFKIFSLNTNKHQGNELCHPAWEQCRKSENKRQGRMLIGKQKLSGRALYRAIAATLHKSCFVFLVDCCVATAVCTISFSILFTLQSFVFENSQNNSNFKLERGTSACHSITRGKNHSIMFPSFSTKTSCHGAYVRSYRSFRISLHRNSVLQ